MAESGAGGIAEATCAAAVAELTRSLIARLEPALDDLGLGDAELERCLSRRDARAAARRGHESALRAIGRHCAQTRGRNNGRSTRLLDQVRATRCASSREQEVAPHAEHIHRHDELVPESLIRKMAELGYFGMSVPEEYGGHGHGQPAR